jgi:hypothetical protein
MTNHPNILCDHAVTDGGTGVVETHGPIEGTEETAMANVQVPEDRGELSDGTDPGDTRCPTMALHTTSQTMELGRQISDRSDGEKILALVFGRMRNFSETYGDAWTAVRRSHPALFRSP